MAQAGFQENVNTYMNVGVEGGWAGADPYASVLAGENQIAAGAGGVTIGRFAWLDATGSTATNAGSGVPAGFVNRENNLAFIVTGPGGPETSMLIPAGTPLTLNSAGDYWVVNAGAAAVTRGMKIFASNTTGQASGAAAGGTVAGSTETKWFAANAAAVGELIKMSSWVQG